MQIELEIDNDNLSENSDEEEGVDLLSNNKKKYIAFTVIGCCRAVSGRSSLIDQVACECAVS